MKPIKRYLSTFVLLVLIVLDGVGQSSNKTVAIEPSFSGTWISKQTGVDKLYHRITIVEDGVEIRMSHEIGVENGETVKKYEHRYFTDGRGETNKRSDGSEFKSTTKRSGTKLTIKYDMGKTRVSRSDEYKVSKNTLTFAFTQQDWDYTQPRLSVIETKFIREGT